MKTPWITRIVGCAAIALFLGSVGEFQCHVKAGQPQKPETAAPSTPEEKETAVASQHLLAVFPWRWVGIGSNFTPGIWKGLYSPLDRTGVFTLAYSYYPVQSRPETRSIQPDLLNESVAGRLWVRRSSAEWFEPDVSLVTEIGNQLGVDAVLMYSFDRIRGWTHMEAFLVDIQKGQVHHAKGKDLPLRPELIRTPVQHLTEEVFGQYEKGHTSGEQ